MDLSQVTEAVGVVGPQRDRALEQRERGFVVVELMMKNTKEVKRLHLVGVAGENPLVDRLRLAEVARPMDLHGQSKDGEQVCAVEWSGRGRFAQRLTRRERRLNRGHLEDAPRFLFDRCRHGAVIQRVGTARNRSLPPGGPIGS